MKLNLKLDKFGAFFRNRGIKLCSEEVKSIFGIGEDVQEVTLTVSRKRFLGSIKATGYCHKAQCPMVSFENQLNPRQLLIETFRVIASRVGIKVNRTLWGYALTPRVVYVRVTPK